MDYSSPEHKDTFEISVKEGNRLGRRLGRGLANIAQAGKRGIIQEPFDPNAYDGDGDGIIQDGSQWARPAVLRSQSLPDLSVDSGTNKPEKERQEVRKETREQLHASRRASGTDKRKKGSRALKSTTADPTNAEWRQTATPRELAEAMVPLSRDEMLELNERNQVPRDAYSNEEDYQFALALHRKARTLFTQRSERQIAAVKDTYDAVHGPDSFDDDMNNNTDLFDERMLELVGDPTEFYKQLGTRGINDPETGAQVVFLHDMFFSPDTPQFIKDSIGMYLSVLGTQNTTPVHGFFVGDGAQGLEKRYMSPVEYVLARLLAEDVDPTTNDNTPKQWSGRISTHPHTVPPTSSEFEAQTTPRSVGGISGYDVAEELLKAYFAHRSRNRTRFSLSGDSAVTDEQIAARFQIARHGGTRAMLFGTIFSPKEQPQQRGDRTLRRSEFFDGSASPAFSDDPRDYAMIRALLLRTLEDNPEFLAAVRKFGMPTVSVPHRATAYTLDPPSLSENILTKRTEELSLTERAERVRLGEYFQSRYDLAIQNDAFGFKEISGVTEIPMMGGSRIIPPAPALGGYFIFGIGQMMLSRETLLKDLFSPSEAERGIIKITQTGSLTELVGEAGILVHEFGHFVDTQLVNGLFGARYEQTRRRIAELDRLYRNDPDPNKLANEIKKEKDALRKFIRDLPPRDSSFMNDTLNLQRRLVNKFLDDNQKMGYVDPEQRITGPILHDFESMTDEELSRFLDDQVSLYQEIHGDTSLMSQRKADQSNGNGRQVAEDSVRSPEPHVVTPYGNTNTRERLSEILAATLTRTGQRNPIMTNNAAVKLVARIFGLNVEPQDVTTLSRRRRVRGRYTDEAEDISDRIISAIKVVSPETSRTSDGHRPGLASRISSDDLRFNPDERSRMKSRSNIGVETDERLYAFTDKPMVKDRGVFGTAPRTYKIGDHHFYDHDAPFTEQGMRFVGAVSARRFINRDRPHTGDMIRAISATQLGFFVDDMPTYPTTTAGQKRVLRALVTGRIAKETTPEERRIIEDAMKDTTHLLREVQMTKPTTRDLYRPIPVDTAEFLDSISVGDVFPIPLTSFSDKAPPTTVGAILRVESGAKARKVDLSDGTPNYITAGNFEVLSVERDGERTIATLRHIETFDPRHSAMRPVDEKRNTPKNMRFVGSERPRYSSEQAERMVLDRERRFDRAKAIGLRSMTTADTELDAEIRDYEKTKDLPDDKLSKIVELTKERIKEFVATSVTKRLAVAIEAVRDKHGDRTPWVDDAQYIRDFATLDAETSRRVAELLMTTIREAIRNFDIVPLDESRPRMDNAEAKMAFAGLFVDGRSSIGMTAAQIRHFLLKGEITLQRQKDKEPVNAKIVVPMSLFETDEMWIEVQKVLEINLRALEATQRAFLLDGSESDVPALDAQLSDGNVTLNGGINVDNIKVEVRPVGRGVYVELHGENKTRTKYNQPQLPSSIFVEASVAPEGSSHSSENGFSRQITTSPDGKLLVHHDRMWLEPTSEGRGRGEERVIPAGVGTVLNQHAMLWWRQHDRSQVSLGSPTADGIIVWPRMGYTKRGNVRNSNFRYSETFPIVLAELTRQVREALTGRSTEEEQRVVLRTDGRPNVLAPPGQRQRFPQPSQDVIGAPPPPPMTKLETVRVTQEGIDFGITPESRRLIIGWLALAEKQLRDGKVPDDDSSLATLLANLLNPKTMRQEAMERWRNIFDLSGMGRRGLIMEFDRNGGTDTDKDWLPEFLIPDPAKVDAERIESSTERAGLLSRAYRSEGDEGVKRDLFIGDADEPMTMEQAGRISGALRSRQSLGTLREESGFNVPPILFTRAELEERQAQFGAPLYGIGRIDTDNGSNQLQRFMFGTNDSSDLVSFTDEPFRHIDRMYVDGSPNSDPATTRNGAVGYLAPWAQVVRGSTLRSAVNQIIKPKDRRKFIAEKDYDGLMDELVSLGHYRLYDTEDGERIGLASSTNKRSANEQVKNRLLKAVADLDNHQRRQNEMDDKYNKYKRVRDKLLENMFSSEQDVEEVLAAILGYDALKEADEVKIINNGAVSILDEIISFAEAVKGNDFQKYRVPPQSMDKRFTGDNAWFDNPTDARLFTRDEPISLPDNGVMSQDYIRSVRQDFNVDLSERRGGLASRSRLDKERDIFRGFARRAEPTVWTKIDDDEFKAKTESVKERFASLQAELEAWDEANLDADRPDWNARDEINEKISVLTDEVASLIKTSNGVIDGAIAHEAAIEALTAFLKERDGANALQDIPDDILRRVATLLQSLLQERNDNPRLLDIDTARKRHGYLKRLLRDTDFGYELRKSGERFDDDMDIELEDVDADFDVQDKSESLLEHLFRGLFDERYDKWAEKQRYVPFGEGNPAFDAMRRLLPPQPVDASSVMGRRIQDLFEGITREQRREWHTTSGQLLDDEYDFAYQEDIIDASPSGGSARPSGIPAPTWRKIRSAMSRARSTKFDGERDAAESAALRLIEKTRPDLATRDYIRGLRSSTPRASSMSSASTASPKATRGGSPDLPAVPVEEQTLGVVANKLREMGYDIDEVDLLPNGKYGSMLRRIFFPSVDDGRRSLEKLLKDVEDGTVELEKRVMGFAADGTIIEMDSDMLRDIVNATIEQARKQGLEVVKVEGHTTKKISGPVDTEVVDLLGDEMDIAMLRAMSSPTYENIVDIAAAYYAERNRLNKAFGAINTDSNAMRTTLGRPGINEGGYTVYRDVRGNEVMRVREGKATNLYVESMRTIRAHHASLGGMSDSHTNTSDAIFGAMAEAVGFQYNTRNQDAGDGFGRNNMGAPSSINIMRRSLEMAKESLRETEFAPTPAGNHLKAIYENKIIVMEQRIDLFERMGKRYVHLMRERGLSDDDIKKTMEKVLLSFGGNIEGQRYEMREPIAPGTGGTIMSQALQAFLRKTLAVSGLPFFTDGGPHEVGMHEIGHFALGQGFTRHGEFVANGWAFFVNGPAHWEQFVGNQAVQTDRFDQWTIKEHFGRTLTPEQQKIIRERVGEGERGSNARHRALSAGDRERIRLDVVDAVRARTDLTDTEKQDVIDDIQKLYDDGGFFIPKTESADADSDLVAAIRDENLNQQSVIEESGLDLNGTGVATSTLLDKWTPLPAHVFGWQRSRAPRPDGMASKTAPKFTKVKGGRPTLPGRDLGKLRRQGDFEKTYPDAAKDKSRLRKQALKYFASLSQRELDAVTDYIGESFAMNYFLRFGKLPRTSGAFSRPGYSYEDQIIRRAEELTDILENSTPLTQPIVLYRGLGDIDIDDYDHIIKLGVGGVFSDDGIISTTTSPSIATNFQGRSSDSYGIPLLEIIVPKGGRALSLVSNKGNESDDPLLDEEYNPVIGELFGNPVVGSYEEEVLLPPKTKFRIVAIIPPKDVYKHDGAFAPYGADSASTRAKIIVEVII